MNTNPYTNQENMRRNNRYSYSERSQIINLLNKMYNDNIHQINNLNNSNNNIRSMLYNLIDNESNNNHNNHNSNRNHNVRMNNTNNEIRHRRPGSRTNNSNSNSTTSINTNTRTNNNGLNRIYINNTPYIIDSYQEYYIPRNSSSLIQRSINTNVTNFFDPVEIFPTSSQIEVATRRVSYCDIVTPRNVQCPISLENFTDNDIVTVIRHCGHIFNTEQLATWFRSNCRCPICRYDIRNYTTSSATLDEEDVQQNNNYEPSSQMNEERNINTTVDSIANVLTNYLSMQSPEQLIGLQDLSGGLLLDIPNISDPDTIRNLLNSLTRQYL